MDFLLGQSGTGIDDAHDALGGIGMHFNARFALPIGLFQTTAQDGIVRVLRQLAQRDHRGGVQMLAEDRHQSIEIHACTADLRGVGRLGSGILHDRSSFPWRRRPSSDAPPGCQCQPERIDASHLARTSQFSPCPTLRTLTPAASSADNKPPRQVALPSRGVPRDYRCKVSIGASLKCWR